MGTRFDGGLVFLFMFADSRLKITAYAIPCRRECAEVTVRSRWGADMNHLRQLGRRVIREQHNRRG